MSYCFFKIIISIIFGMPIVQDNSSITRFVVTLQSPEAICWKTGVRVPHLCGFVGLREHPQAACLP